MSKFNYGKRYRNTSIEGGVEFADDRYLHVNRPLWAYNYKPGSLGAMLNVAKSQAVARPKAAAARAVKVAKVEAAKPFQASAVARVKGALTLIEFAIDELSMAVAEGVTKTVIDRKYLIGLADKMRIALKGVDRQ
jgi:hypothetical protein